MRQPDWPRFVEHVWHIQTCEGKRTYCGLILTPIDDLKDWIAEDPTGLNRVCFICITRIKELADVRVM